jgi:hypothetical protein
MSLPSELIEEIISQAWYSPLDLEDRIALMTTFTLVNKAWTLDFVRNAFRDIHVPCLSYADHLLSKLCQSSTMPINVDDLCRSITVHLKPRRSVPPVPTDEEHRKMGDALSSVLYVISVSKLCPNLRSVVVECHNFPPEDLFYHYRLSMFPEQVTHLDISYSFDAHIPPWLLSAMESQYKREESIPWSLPSIRCLSITGAPRGFVADFISVCPQLGVLATDVMDLHVLAPPPESLYALKLKLGTSPSTRTDVEEQFWHELTSICEENRVQLSRQSSD